MRTKDVLKEAIQAFDGTVILVSHDRDFLDGLVDKVYEFGGGLVREHIGGIYDFLRRKDLDTLDQLHTDGNPSASSAPQAAAAAEPSEGKVSYEERKEQARRRRKAERAVEQCEAHVIELEEQKATLEARLATPEGAADANLFAQYADLQTAIKQAEAAWEEALAELDEM